MNNEFNEIDFSGEEFEVMQKMLNGTSQLKELSDSKNELLNNTISNDSSDILDKNLTKFQTPEELKEFLAGDIKNPEVIKRVNSLFIDEESGIEIEINKAIIENDNPVEFKRDLAIYIKNSDYYMGKIEQEVEDLNKSTNELNKEMSEALKELDDNAYGYGKYLIDKAKIEEDDDIEQIKAKRILLQKGEGIISGYTFDMLFKLIEEKPSIIKNALSDFHSEKRVKEVGKRYVKKLDKHGIKFNLINFLNNDIHNSIEYLYLPRNEYSEGLENFFVFFIIRSSAMSLDDVKSINFHASIYITLSKLKNDTLNPNIKEMVVDNMIKFLSYFN